MELIFNARQPSRCPELPAGHGNYAYWQKSTASSSEQRRNPCLQDGKALEGLQARPDPVYEPMSVSLIFRLGQKESRWTPQPESSGIRFYRIHHKCNAQQYHQKFFHTLFSFFLMIPSLFCPHYTDWAGRYGCPSYTSHKKGTRHSHFECTVFLLSAFSALLLHKSQSFISAYSVLQWKFCNSHKYS